VLALTVSEDNGNA
jgi:hypothetical protein